MNGILVPPAQTHAIYMVLNRLDKNRAVLIDLSKGALARSQIFSWQDNVKGLYLVVLKIRHSFVSNRSLVS